jgi:hypothetical protein
VLCLQLPAISNSPLIKHLTSSYSILLSQFEYTYDADGQIQSWTQQADAGTPKTSVLAPKQANLENRMGGMGFSGGFEAGFFLV